MQLHEIENMTAADLKARRDELAAEAAKAPPAELAARYVQARLDAKMRDETMATQGTTITSLNGALADAQQKNGALSVQVGELQAVLLESQNAGTRLLAEAETLRGEVVKQTELANKRRQALASVMLHANSLNAAVAPLLAE